MYITIEELQEHPDVVMFGSHALGVSDKASDYDFALTSKTFSKLKQENRIPIGSYVDISAYLQSLPSNASSVLYNTGIENKDRYIYSVDFLILEDTSDVDTVSKAINALRKYPKEVLLDKGNRITLYNEQLVKYGFLPRKNIARKTYLAYSEAFSDLTDIYRAYRMIWNTDFLTVGGTNLYFHSLDNPITDWIPSEEDLTAVDWVVEYVYSNDKSKGELLC